MSNPKKTFSSISKKKCDRSIFYFDGSVIKLTKRICYFLFFVTKVFVTLESKVYIKYKHLTLVSIFGEYA